MHAYAAEDPVFLAMNARGQRETKGALGDFCVKCHAPMAVQTGATKDGLNLAEVPQKLRGVTCFFCHSVESVAGTHDNPLVLASDGVMRGGIADPVRTGAHEAAYSALLDRGKLESASLCGAATTSSRPSARTSSAPTPSGKARCSRTPAPRSSPAGSATWMVAAASPLQAPGVKLRKVHGHGFPGVDVALTDFPRPRRRPPPSSSPSTPRSRPRSA